MDTCFEVAILSKTNLANDIVANSEIELYGSYCCCCCQEITLAAATADLKIFQAKLLVDIALATFHKDFAQNWVD